MPHFSSYNTSDPNAVAAGYTPLTADQVLVLGPMQTDRAQVVAGSVYSDQAGVLMVQQSFDGINWDIADTIDVTAATVSGGFMVNILAPTIQLTYTNGGANQGTFRLFARTYATGW
jgi:hypothetical protein